MNNGPDWVKSRYQTELSPLGEAVATLLWEWASGIYHLEDMLRKVDWTNNRWIEFNYYNEVATFDWDNLTKLVFFAHWFGIRISIQPCNFRYIKIMFHPRKRVGGIFAKHPTLDQAVNDFKELMAKYEIREVGEES